MFKVVQIESCADLIRVTMDAISICPSIPIQWLLKIRDQLLKLRHVQLKLR